MPKKRNKKKKDNTLLIVFILIVLLGGIIYLIKNCDKKEEVEINKFYIEEKYYNEGKYIKIKSDDYNNIKDESYVLFIYNNFCTMKVPCEYIFEKVMKKYKIDFLSMGIDDFKKIELYNEVKYAPSIIIVNKGNIVTYLDAESDADSIKYHNEEEFEKWIDKYIYLTK